MIRKGLFEDKNLRDLYLFASLDEQQFKRICRSAIQFRLGNGEVLFQHGRPAERFFVLLDGHIKLIRISAAGTEKVIEIIRPGESFAEAVMFRTHPIYPVTAQAILPSTVLGFENKIFLEILGESFETCKRVMAKMSVRLHIWLDEIDNLTLQNATYRLVHHLLSRVQDCRENCVVELAVPKQVLASRLSIKPETFSRILHQLAEERLLTVQGGNVKICDPEGLRRYVFPD